MAQLAGFPSDAGKDVYDLDKKLAINNFDVQWSNGEDDPSKGSIDEITAETKQTFKDVVESIEAASRAFAK